MAKVETYTFINDQLDAQYNYTLEHGKGTLNVNALWIDDSDIIRNTTDVVQIVDEDNILISCGAPITGNNTILLFYDDSATFEGRRLFELQEITNIIEVDDTLRLALGKAGVTSKNIAMSLFYSLITSKTNLISSLNGFSEIPASVKTTCRANLQVYSITEIINLLYPKLTGYGGVFGQGLSTTNTSSYTPTSNYHPATKKYIDDLTNVVAGTIDTSGQDAQITLDDILVYKKQGKVCSLDMDVRVLNSLGTGVWIRVGVVSFPPESIKYGAAYHRSANTTVKVGYVKIEADGNLYINLMTDGVIYSFELVYFAE